MRARYLLRVLVCALRFVISRISLAIEREEGNVDYCELFEFSSSSSSLIVLTLGGKTCSRYVTFYAYLIMVVC